jgi:pyruvate dehydrogenase E2 component (dihydrolipoamide acetyltransferase)
MSDKQILSLFEEGSYEIVPHDGMRRTIAQRLTAATQSVPTFYLTIDCDIGRLLDAREQINAAAPKDKEKKPLYKLSVNDFVIKALAVALQQVPDCNVSWTEAGMVKHKHSDIGVAVAMPGGLITPIIRNAESKSLSTISNEMKDLAARARTRKLKPQEYQGGTSSVSNLGMFGISHFTAVINPPQSTILAVGASEERAVVRNGKIEAAHIMSATLSCDHRAIDGALGAELIGAFRRLIENPVMMMVDSRHCDARRIHLTGKQDCFAQGLAMTKECGRNDTTHGRYILRRYHRLRPALRHASAPPSSASRPRSEIRSRRHLPELAAF